MSERHQAWENVARKLAHEIKNPLTPIQLSLDRIKEKYLNKIEKDDKNFSSYLNTIGKQIKDIENLVNEFSNFARMPKPIFKKIDFLVIFFDQFLALGGPPKPKNVIFGLKNAVFQRIR